MDSHDRKNLKHIVAKYPDDSRIIFLNRLIKECEQEKNNELARNGILKSTIKSLEITKENLNEKVIKLRKEVSTLKKTISKFITKSITK